MNAKISVFVICVETIMYLLLYHLRDFDFNFWLVKTILSNFFRHYCHRKYLLHLVKSYFSTNPSFRLVETYFLSSGNSMLFCSKPFFCFWKPWLKLEGINFNRKIFFCWWKPFSIFLPEETVFLYSGNIFFNNSRKTISVTASISRKKLGIKKYYIQHTKNLFSQAKWKIG